MAKKKNRRVDKTKIKDKVVEELSHHLREIDRLLRENDRRTYTWEDDKAEEMITLALCHSSRNFDQANKFASNLSGLFQHVQGQTCSLSGYSSSETNTADYMKKIIPRSWLNLKGEGSKRVEGEIMIRADKHNIPWDIIGECEDCHYNENPIRKGSTITQPCDGCGSPEHRMFKQKKK